MNVAETVRLLLVLGAALATPAFGQIAADSSLDPESPMDAMPGLGVDWPDMTKSLGPADSAETPAVVEAGERRYSVMIEGIATAERAAILARFNALSTLKAGEGKSANAAQIDRRAREDSDLLDRLLRAAGYYDAAVDARVDSALDGRLQVTLTAEPGVLYRFSDVNITGFDQADAGERALHDGVTLAAKDAVNVDDIIINRERLKETLNDSGYPFAKIGEPDVVVDHDTQLATLDLNVQPGGLRNFGTVRLTGTKLPFDARHVARIARFKTGERYNQDDIDDLKRALIATGLVSSASVEPVPGTDEKTADIAVNLEPAKLRTIAAEAGYGTGEGFRISASWTHRNLLRPEGAVTFKAILGTQEQYAGGVLRQSNFRKRDQVLNARIDFSHQNRRAFNARSFEVAAGIERQTNIIWQKKWIWSAGFELVTSDERDIVGAGIARRRTYYIAALPGTLNYDGTDSLLDPTRGYRLGFRLSPEISFQGSAFQYARGQIDASAYLPAGKKVVLAGRVRLGTILGAPADAIAPSRRFYAGGGGSVRGYGYQAIGPRDIANDPDGGRSLAEFALEARVRVGNFGVVPFLDGGNIYNRAYPDFSGFRYGAGIGARYYSNFGPIRIDVGTPLNRQKGDSRVTVFVSLGQAF